MANNRVKINCDIDADIGQAKKAISDLQRSIEKLSKAQINTNYLDKGINNAVAAAKELEHHLNAALNQNTGKLNLNAFTSSLEQSNISAKDLMQTLLQGGSAGQQTFASLANAIAQSEVPLRRANKTLQDFATTLKNTVKWEISSTMVHGLESALSGAVSYAKNLNTSLTNIRIVTGQSVDDMARFAKEANVAAKALSTTTKSYADASLIYYQQGDSQELAAKKAAITIKAANSSFETSAKEMSEYLTSVWNSYQVGADELERYVDIMANLGAKTATSLEEIATSMQKVAATANTVGVSMEQVSSIIATVSSVTRESAESIGTSYKTIFARIGDLKLGNVDEDGIGLGQVSSQLDAIGVKILDESGNLREMGDIIIDLGTKWQTMNQAQKTAVAQVVAGKRQYTQLMALFENWDMFQSNMNIAENSEGALQKMQDTYAESWKAASARVQASIEGIYNKILNDQAIITITNGIADLIGAVDTLIERLGGMSGMLSTLGGIGINVFSKQIAGGINKTVSSLKTYFSQFSGFGDFVSKGKNGQILNNEQINYQKSLADWDKAIDEVKSKQGEDSPEALALQNSKDLLDMKQQLINAEYSLSDAEKARAQNLLAQISNEQAHLLELSQQKKQIAQQEEQQKTRYLQQLSNKTVDETQRETLPAEYRKEVKEYRKTSEQTASIGSAISSLERIKTEGTDVVVKEIERLKQILGDSLPAKIFDDFNGDVDALIADLQKAQDKSIETAATIATRFKQNKTPEQQEIIDNLFADIDDTSSTKIDLKLGTSGATDVLDNIKGKFNSLFGKDSKLMNSLGDKLTAAAGTLASMQGGFESGASWMEVWNDETAGFGDHLAAASGILTNLASGFAAGGPWGLALTAVMAIVGGIIQAAEEAKRAYQEAQQADYDKIKEEASKKDEEFSNIQSLMKNYNTLKETYETTGQGQDALAASARALADAYGLVGANVLIAENNFKEFENLVARSAGLDVLSNFYQEKMNETRSLINDDNSHSKYYDESKIQEASFAYDTEAAHRQFTAAYYDQIKPKFSKKLLQESVANISADELVGDYYLDTIAAAETALQEYQKLSTNFTDFEQLITVTQSRVKNSKKRDDYMDPLSLIFSDNIENGMVTLDPETYQEELMNSLYSYFDPEIFELFQGDYENNEAPSYLLDKFQSMLIEGEDGALNITESDLNEFLQMSKNLKIKWLDDFVKWGKDQSSVLFQQLFDTDLFYADVDYELALEEREKAIELAREGYQSVVIDEAYAEYQDIVGGPIDQNYFDSLTNEKGLISYNDEGVDQISWYQNFLRQQQAAKDELNKLQAKLDSGELKEKPLLETIIATRVEVLTRMVNDLNALEDTDLTDLVKQYTSYEESATKIKLLSQAMVDLIGKSEANTGFNVFSDSIDKIKNGIDASAKSYESLQKYLIADASSATGYKMAEDGTYAIKEGLKESYEAARNQIVAGFISDYTSFDDFLMIYQDLAAIFTGDKFDAVKNYINTEGIKDARLVNSRLINSMKQDLQGDSLSISEDTNKVLQFNKQELAAKDSIQAYKDFDKLASSYKDNLSYDEALALQQSLLKDGNIEWEAFVNMDADARKTYLESRKEASMAAAKLAQKQLAATARKQQEQLYVTEEDYKDDKALVDTFFNDYEKTKDGRYALKEHEGVYAATSYAEHMEAMRAKTQDYKSLGQVAEDADTAVAAFELLDSNAERVVTKIERMHNAISKLPSDMEEFNKLAKQLGNINPKELINMSNLDRAKLILEKLEKPTEAQFTTWDAQAQENIFNAGGYAEALAAWKEANKSAVAVITNNANEAFVNMEKRMQTFQTKAEQLKTAAETLSGAIETGELTESQKIGIPKETLTAWENAADAPARAVIAMSLWNEVAEENKKIAEELPGIYEDAKVAVLKTIPDDEIKKAFEDGLGKETFEKILVDSKLDKEVHGAFLKAWSNLEADGFDFSTIISFDQLKQKLLEELSNMGIDVQKVLNTATAATTDGVVQYFNTMRDQNVEAAEEAAQAWLNAFNTIKDAREKLINGGNLLEDIAGDPEKFLELLQSYRRGEGKENATAQEFYNAILNGNVTYDQLKYQTDQSNYIAGQNAKYGLNLISYTGAQFGTLNRVADLNAIAKSQGYDSYASLGKENSDKRKAVEDLALDYYESLFKTRDDYQQNAREMAQKVLSGDSESYQLLKEIASDMRSSIGVTAQGKTDAATKAESISLADKAVKDYNETYNKLSQEQSDWIAIKEALELKEQKKATGVVDALDEKAAGIQARMAERGFTDLESLTLAQVDEQINNATVAIKDAQVTLQGELNDARVTGENQVSGLTTDESNSYEDAVNKANENTLKAEYEQTNAIGPEILSATESYNYLEELNSQFKALDTFEATPKIENLHALADALDLTNDKIATYYNELASAESTAEREQAIDNLTTAILTQSDAQLTNSQASEILLKQYKDLYGITDEYGNLLTTDSINAMRKLSKEQKQIIDRNKKMAKTTKDLRKEYSKLSEDAFDETVDSLEDLSDAEKDQIKDLDNMYDAFDDLRDLDLENFTDDFADQLVELNDIEFDDTFMDNLFEGIEADYGKEKLTALFDNIKSHFQNNTYAFSDEVSAMFQDAKMDISDTINLVMSELQANSGNLSLVDWGMIENQVGVDVNYIIQLMEELISLYGTATATDLVDLTNKLAAAQTAKAAAQKVQSKWGSGGRGGGGAKNANTGSGSGGGGGSKDKKKEKKDLVRYKDEIERYHVQNETLERISENLDEIDKLKDRAYGKNHLAQLEAETEALNEQLIAQQDLHDEALKWMEADKADLAKYGAKYDENGTIINYEEVMQRIIDEYNAAIETYNNSSQGEGDKLALEAAEQQFEDAKEAIENYEEALSIANDSANEMLEIQNKMSELEVEKITYELELKIDMNERDLEMLEYYQEKYSEELGNQDKLFNTFIQSAAEYEDNLAQLGKAYDDLNRQYEAGLINEAHYAEAITELQGQIVDNLNSLQEIQNELAETYANTLELAREEIERTTDAIDHSNEALRSFMDITRLTGNDTEYKKLGAFYDQMYNNNLTKINVQKAHLDSLLEEEERFQEKIRNGQQLTELEKAEYAALTEQIQETRDTLLSSVIESLEVVRESYENTINSIADDLDNFMAGAAGSMAYLQEQYGYFQEEQERYVSTSKELYEVSKLNRDIEGTLATTTSSAAKEALKALQEKINKQSELNELTEYDIEMNQLQYQLLLARIKLEEAQNAKDVVRLTRDENGNYAYRYTANQDKIDEAAQHYEDVLQQINDTTVQRTSEIEQQLLNTMVNYKEKFQEIATDYSLTEEERLMRLEELNNQFSETMRYLQEQNNIVTNNLTANQEAIAGHYGTTMSEITASTAGNVNDTIQSMIDKTEEYITAMNNAIFGEEGAQSAWQKYLAQLGDIEGSADVAYDSLLGNAQEMGEMNGFAAEEALEVIQTLRDTLDPLEALSSAWDAHNAILEATISNYENLAQVIQGVLSAIGEIPNGGSTNVDGTHKYAKGGLVDYTGLAWVDGTASNPEMMLNPGDTQNILKATAMVKSLDSGFIGSLVESVKNAAAAMLHMFGGAYHAVTNVHTANDSALDQNVHITAEFPNVQNHTEIEEAFDNLINQAAQFAHRKN